MACAAQHGTCIDRRQHRHSSKLGGSFTEYVDVAVIGGGQSGLATAHALPSEGLRPVVLEASDTAAGSWPRYYDSPTLFSPARYSSLPGIPFPGDPGHRPHRDEVAAYLTGYAACLDADIRTGHRITGVRRGDAGFEVELADDSTLGAPAVVAASGTFGRPHRPALAGLDGFTGTVPHAADYRRPEALRRPAGRGGGSGELRSADCRRARQDRPGHARHPRAGEVRPAEDRRT
ncbi:NAD(P)-binding domain-containing protein [Streptomyces sp. NPDC012825]|uniref:NAD(P)-binding domain-containing protein n=1 Tax=Streptomyces sp. NPDC012825 TaxID=3364851 RepID=UPI003680D986